MSDIIMNSCRENRNGPALYYVALLFCWSPVCSSFKCMFIHIFSQIMIIRNNCYDTLRKVVIFNIYEVYIYTHCTNECKETAAFGVNRNDKAQIIS